MTGFRVALKRLPASGSAVHAVAMATTAFGASLLEIPVFHQMARTVIVNLGHEGIRQLLEGWAGMARGKAGGSLMRAALKFLKKANRRNRPGRMTPHFRDHVFGGHVKPGHPTGSGYHYRPGGQDFPGRRIDPATVTRNPANGVYSARVEFFDSTMNPPHGVWKPKGGHGGLSTFYPDHWTPAQVDAAPAGAFRNAVPAGGNKWRGTYNGVTIEGFYNGTGGYTHGWPVL